MWKQLFDLFTNVLTLTQRVDRLEQTVKDQQQEMRKMSDLLQALAFELSRTNDRVRHGQENEAHEREKFMLIVEKELIKAGRQLPPKPEDEK